jgi:isopentenyl phosphate kinase
MNAPLVFLKLGGSMLGDKRRRTDFRTAAVVRAAREITAAREAVPGMGILLAHGGGGFAHFPARKFSTRQGLPGGGGWEGFCATRRGVIEMNRRVLDTLARGGVHPVLQSPSAQAVAREGRVARWDLGMLRRLVAFGQVPLIHGDCVLDLRIGFTILSTEELFAHLAVAMRPARIVLACDVEGVYLDPRRKAVIPRVDRRNIGDVRRLLARAGTGGAADVTGRMAAKVERLYELATRRRGLDVRIVSGLKPGALRAALVGDDVGTRIG